MKKLFFIPVLCILISCGGNDLYTISTDHGDITIEIFETTPIHKSNFKKLVKDGYYDGLLFHRVMENYIIQGGDPESRDAPTQMPLGSGSPGYTLPAEIGIPHFTGMVAAARQGDDVNPAKESSGSQFYIVVGRPVSDEELDVMEKAKGIKYSPAQRDKYKKIGGTPMLDGDYTVFGEVKSGLEVANKIAMVVKDDRNRPIQDIKITIK